MREIIGKNKSVALSSLKLCFSIPIPIAPHVRNSHKLNGPIPYICKIGDRINNQIITLSINGNFLLMLHCCIIFLFCPKIYQKCKKLIIQHFLQYNMFQIMRILKYGLGCYFITFLLHNFIGHVSVWVFFCLVY